MTIGDVLAAVAALLTLGASWGAAILLAALAFPRRATRAQTLLTEHPWACLGRGAAALVVCGLPALLLAQAPGPARLLLLVPLGLLAAGALVGSAAVVRLLGGRIDEAGSPLTPFAALTRASFLYVSAGFLPVVGWFLVLPASLLLAVGAGLPALLPARAPHAFIPGNTTGGRAMNTSRRGFLCAGAALGAGLLTGCQSIEQRLTRQGLPPDALPPPNAVSLPAVRLLSRAAYGPRPGDIALVTKIGIPAWVDAQLQPETLAEDAGLAWRLRSLNDALNPDTGTLFDEDDRRLVTALRQATLLRAVYSRRQLEQRIVEFWTDHFNIYAFKGQGPQLKVVDDAQAIRPHVLGRFRDLLGASAHSAAMLGYLDNTANRRGLPNENYARELMELHTLGVHGGYTQRDVHEAARCLSGWTSDTHWHRGQFQFDAAAHDDGAKQVLGTAFLAGGGQKDGERLLDLLAAHPATARHLAAKLCRHFLGDAPQPWVRRLAASYTETGGDIKAMLRSLLLSEDLLHAAPLFKRPYDYAVSALRALGADTDGGVGMQQHLEAMGQPLFGWPMPDGYPEKQPSWTGAMVPRWNFALALAGGAIENTTLDVSSLRAAAWHAGLSPHEAVLHLAFGPSAAEAGVADLRGRAADYPDVSEYCALVLASPAFAWR